MSFNKESFSRKFTESGKRWLSLEFSVPSELDLDRDAAQFLANTIKHSERRYTLKDGSRLRRQIYRAKAIPE